MPSFVYRARDFSGKQVEGRLEAQSEREVAAILRERGYFVTAIQEDRPQLLQKEISLSLGTQRVNLKDLALFARGLAVMLEAGVPLLSALSSLSQQTANRFFASVIRDIASKIERGYSFSQAVSEHMNVFGRVFLGMVRSGEAGGSLDSALSSLADYFDWEKDLRDKVQSAMYYPVILLVAMIAASFFMVYFVFPQFVMLFEGLNIELPLPTKLLLSMVRLVNTYWYAVYGGLLGSFASFLLYAKSERGRRWWDRKKHRLMLFGELFQKLVLSRFSWVLSGLLRSGMSMVQALEVTAEAVSDYYVADILREIASKIRQGRNLTQSMGDYSFFPPLLLQMVSVGEESGNLEATLKRANELYDKEVKIFVERLSTMIEPILTLIVGVGVFFIALAFFMPIFEMASQGMQSSGF
jgi:type II secretory pathway component PulF